MKKRKTKPISPVTLRLNQLVKRGQPLIVTKQSTKYKTKTVKVDEDYTENDTDHDIASDEYANDNYDGD